MVTDPVLRRILADADESFNRFGGIPGAINVGLATVRNNKRGLLAGALREQKFTLPVPPGLRNRVRAVAVLLTHTIDIGGTFLAGSWRSYRSSLVLFFKDPSPITGLPVPPYFAKKYAKLTPTHVAAERREGKPWRLAFYKRDIKPYGPPPTPPYEHYWKDKEILRLDDELDTLQWLYENGAEELFDIPVLASWDFFPTTDRQRIMERFAHELFARDSGHCGVVLPFQNELSTHRFKLRKRFEEIAKNRKTFDAERAYASTRVGSQVGQQLPLDLQLRSYYWSPQSGRGSACYLFDGGGYGMSVDATNGRRTLDPIRTSVEGVPLLPPKEECVTAQTFSEAMQRVYPAR